MSDIVQVALITGISSAVPSLFVAWLNYRKINGVHSEMNGMKKALVEGAMREGHTQGMKDEKANPS